MKIVLAPDSFKGSLTASQACAAMSVGVRRAVPDAVIAQVPLADGGEGTMEILVAAQGGCFVECAAVDALGAPVIARIGLLPGRRAVVEVAEMAGLAAIAKELRNPLLATSFGVGQAVRLALDKGAREVIVCLGGSATNDGGAGFLQALGARLLDDRGEELPRGAGALPRLAQIDLAAFDARVADTVFTAACDVDAPLVGERGASVVYGPQKGATLEMVRQLDDALGHFAAVILADFGRDVRDIPGAGASGGVAAALLGFCRATLISGANLVQDAVGFQAALRGAALVITGEGRCDRQTLQGKVVSGVARAARMEGVPAVVLAGVLGEGHEALYEHGLTAAFALADGSIAQQEAMARAAELAAAAAERVVRLFAAGWRCALFARGNHDVPNEPR